MKKPIKENKVDDMFDDIQTGTGWASYDYILNSKHSPLSQKERVRLLIKLAKVGLLADEDKLNGKEEHKNQIPKQAFMSLQDLERKYKSRTSPNNEIKEDTIPGGLSDGKTLQDIANKHTVDIDELTKEYQKGIKVELEHTSDRSIAEEIARDHLFENPKYYTKLATIETESVNEDVSNVNQKKQGYVKFFKDAMKKAGISNIKSLSDSEKKEFFNKIDNTWKSKNENVNEAGSEYYNAYAYKNPTDKKHLDSSTFARYSSVLEKWRDNHEKQGHYVTIEFMYKGKPLRIQYQTDREKLKKLGSLKESINIVDYEPVHGSYGFDKLSKLADTNNSIKLSKNEFDGILKLLKRTGTDIVKKIDTNEYYTIYSLGNDYNLVRLKMKTEGLNESKKIGDEIKTIKGKSLGVILKQGKSSKSKRIVRLLKLDNKYKIQFGNITYDVETSNPEKEYTTYLSESINKETKPNIKDYITFVKSGTGQESKTDYVKYRKDLANWKSKNKNEGLNEDVKNDISVGDIIIYKGAKCKVLKKLDNNHIAFDWNDEYQHGVNIKNVKLVKNEGLNEDTKDDLMSGGMKTWWTYDKKDVMSFVYWLQRQIPPTGPKFDKEWKNVAAQLQKKHPAPKGEYERVISESVNERKEFPTKEELVKYMIKGGHGRESSKRVVDANYDYVKKYYQGWGLPKISDVLWTVESINEEYTEDEKDSWEYVLSQKKGLSSKSQSKSKSNLKNLYKNGLIYWDSFSNSSKLTNKGEEYLKKHGNKLSESVNESDSFTKQQIDTLKTGYGSIEKINPSSPTYKKLTDMLDSLSIDKLKQLSKANIKFVSMLAANRVKRLEKNESVNEDDNSQYGKLVSKSTNFQDFVTKVLIAKQIQGSNITKLSRDAKFLQSLKSVWNNNTNESVNEVKRKHYNDIDDWQKARRKLKVKDDTEYSSTSYTGKLNALWNKEANVGWIDEAVNEDKKITTESVNETNVKIKKTITRKDWNKKQKDSKLMGKDGIPYIMAYDDKIGTHLVPVKIVDESVNEAKFGYKDSTSSYITDHNNEDKLAKSINKKVGGDEIKFYDELENVHDKLGHPKYMKWLSNALRGWSVDMYKDPKIKNKAEAEEALYLLSK
jgi:hypothetical protein